MIPVGDKHDCSCPLTGRPHSLTHVLPHLDSYFLPVYSFLSSPPTSAWNLLLASFHLLHSFPPVFPSSLLPRNLPPPPPPPPSSSFALFTRTSYTTASPNQQLSS
ncbi:hypothetical protein LY76DRAFT_85100 [Colletotrichum caudatum]|nr:hypothetical protein LY76DRAFT_85100 [Colletotrichum caudatum]